MDPCPLTIVELHSIKVTHELLMFSRLGLAGTVWLLVPTVSGCLLGSPYSLTTCSCVRRGRAEPSRLIPSRTDSPFFKSTVLSPVRLTDCTRDGGDVIFVFLLAVNCVQATVTPARVSFILMEFSAPSCTGGLQQVQC